MKERYEIGIEKYDRIIMNFEKQKELHHQLKEMPCDFAKFNINEWGYSMINLWVAPMENQFSASQMRQLRTLLNNEFNIKNRVPPKDTPDYNRVNFIWSRKFVESTGSFRLCRDLLGHWEGYTLSIIIEEAPARGCKVEKKEVTRTIYVTNCKDVV